MWATICQQVIVFAIVVAWEWTGVYASRSYAGQSLAALPLSAVLCGFWLIGITICKNRRVWPVTIAGAILGTWLGISWP